jgi:hypothetical protein
MNPNAGCIVDKDPINDHHYLQRIRTPNRVEDRSCRNSNLVGREINPGPLRKIITPNRVYPDIVLAQKTGIDIQVTAIQEIFSREGSNG